MSPEIIHGAVSWRGKKIYLGRKNYGARKVAQTPRLRKKKYKWQNKKKSLDLKKLSYMKNKYKEKRE